MIQRATSRNMGPQGWRPLLAPKPTGPLTTLVGECAHILCLLRLHGRFSLLSLQKRSGRPVDQAVLQLIGRVDHYQTRAHPRTTALRIAGAKTLPQVARVHIQGTSSVTRRTEGLLTHLIRVWFGVVAALPSDESTQRVPQENCYIPDVGPNRGHEQKKHLADSDGYRSPEVGFMYPDRIGQPIPGRLHQHRSHSGKQHMPSDASQPRAAAGS